MNPALLKRAIEDVLDEFEERDYLGMSAISTCPRELYRRMVDGRPRPDAQGKRYCHEGYLHEDDIVRRLDRAGWKVLNRGRELVAPFDKRFAGHIDGDFDGALMLEIKSVKLERFDEIARTNRAPDAHYEQVQVYLRYGGYSSCMLIYKCREDGQVWALEVERNDKVGARLEEKARKVLEAIDRVEPPACRCGHCR